MYRTNRIGPHYVAGYDGPHTVAGSFNAPYIAKVFSRAKVISRTALGDTSPDGDYLPCLIMDVGVKEVCSWSLHWVQADHITPASSKLDPGHHTIMGNWTRAVAPNLLPIVSLVGELIVVARYAVKITPVVGLDSTGVNSADTNERKMALAGMARLPCQRAWTTIDRRTGNANLDEAQIMSHASVEASIVFHPRRTLPSSNQFYLAGWMIGAPEFVTSDGKNCVIYSMEGGLSTHSYIDDIKVIDPTR